MPSDLPKSQASDLPPRVAERRALERALGIEAKRVLCTTLGRGQAAFEFAAHHSDAEVTCWILDEYLLRLARVSCWGALRRNRESGLIAPTIWGRARLANLALTCSADPPPGPVDLAVVPFSYRGEAELARDLLQSACGRLELGGTLVAAVDNPADHWLHEQLREFFSKVTVERSDDAVVYVARKTTESRKLRNFRCEFAFRDSGRLLRAVTRPGVFSHRRLDAGARQLLGAADAAAGSQVLDIGCGSGAVGIALAARDASTSVHAVDSSARAVQCALAGAARNGLSNYTVDLNSTGRYGRAGRYDLAVANPPYFAHFRIAELFLRGAHRSLRSGGRIVLVTKLPDWYEQAMPASWLDVECRLSKGYHLVTATRP